MLSFIWNSKPFSRAVCLVATTALMLAGARAQAQSVTLALTHTLTMSTAQAGPSLVSVKVNAANVIGGRALTGTVTLSSNATVATRVALKYRDASVSGPSGVMVAVGSSTATFVMHTVAVSKTQVEVVTGSLNGVDKGVGFNILSYGIVQLALAPPKVNGGDTAVGTVTLSSAAPVGGAVINLLTNRTDLGLPPATITVPAGQTSATFSIKTATVPADKVLIIYAKNSGLLLTASLTILTPQVSSVKFNVPSIGIGQKVTATFTITSKAPAVGTVLTVASNPPDVILNPTTVKIPAGATSVSSVIQVGAPFITTKVALSATRNAITKVGLLTVTGVPGSIFPLIVGKAWTYDYTDTEGKHTTKVLTCVGPSTLLGVPAVKFSYGTGDDFYYSLSTLGLLEVGEVHAADSKPIQPYVGPLILVPPTTTVGYHWTQTHTREFRNANGSLDSTQNLTETGTVVGPEAVIVPAGAYAAFHVHIVTSGGASATHDYWYVPNIGKVKEVIVESALTSSYVLKSYK